MKKLVVKNFKQEPWGGVQSDGTLPDVFLRNKTADGCGYRRCKVVNFAVGVSGVLKVVLK